MFRWATYIIFCCSSLFSNEGLFSHKQINENLSIIAHFLPYNPTILLLGASSEVYEDCKTTWPLAKILTSPEDSLQNGRKIDFLWTDGNTQIGPYFLKNSSVLFTVKFMPTPPNMCLCTAWEKGLFFLKDELYDGFVKSLDFHPQSTTAPLFEFRKSLVFKYLNKISDSLPASTIRLIDSIYMINLKERPEKFSASLSQLQEFGITPYRFGAINGWNLSIQVLNELGIQPIHSIKNEKIMGKVYREIDKVEYKNMEFIKDPHLTYFCTGMTRGAIGCLLSHLSVLQHGYESKAQVIWIMEDDIQIIRNPHQLSALIEELNQLDPSWDILFTDIDSKNSQGDLVPCRALAMRPDMTIHPISHYLNQFLPINARLSQVGMRYGAYSMIVHRSGIEKILNYYKNHGIFLPYDCDFWLIPSIKMYRPNEEIISVAYNLPSNNGIATYQESQEMPEPIYPNQSEEDSLLEGEVPRG